jgi:hypothetical protein
LGAALASSWALFNNASLNEVLSAGFWRGESSFASHYLRSMSVQADNLFSLGTIVSVQRVNFPPVSSDHIQVEMVLTERSKTPFLIGIKSLLLVLERKEAVLVK